MTLCTSEISKLGPYIFLAPPICVSKLSIQVSDRKKDGCLWALPMSEPSLHSEILPPKSSPRVEMSAGPSSPDLYGFGRRDSFSMIETPSFFPRRSPRLSAFATPMFSSLTPQFSMPSPPLPSVLTKNPLELRRSPRLAANKPDAPFSPSAFLTSPMVNSALPPPHSLNSTNGAKHLNQAAISLGPYQEGVGQYENDDDAPSTILNKLQQNNFTAKNRKRRRESDEDLGDKLKSSSASGAMLPQFTPPLHSASTPVASLPDMPQLPKSSGNGSGSSCHQCKSRRQLGVLIFCSNMFKRSSKDKKQQQQNRTGKDKRHVCRKKYCDQCLQKFYHERPPNTRQDPNSTWTCPACRGICCCAACRRQKAKLQQSVDPLRMSPATSLACGLVYFKDMLKFRLGDPANGSSSSEFQKALQSIAGSAARSNSSSAEGNTSSSASAPPPSASSAMKQEESSSSNGLSTMSILRNDGEAEANNGAWRPVSVGSL